MLEQNYSKKNRITLFITASLSIILLWFLAPIEQSLSYHNFAEQRTFLNIPHIGDVISNLAFIIVGLLLLKKHNFEEKDLTSVNRCQLFLLKSLAWSSIFLGFGSGYYHWNPYNMSLALDRATMVLGFAVIFYDSMIRYSIIGKNNLCTGLYTVGILFLTTVLWWIVKDRLEPYVFIQFFTMFGLIALVILNYKKTPSKNLFLMFVWYAVAKICETLDTQIYHLTFDMVSGHTLKHLAYAMALYVFGKYMIMNKCENKNILF